MAEKRRFKDRFVSAIVIHEVYNPSLSREGREVAKLSARHNLFAEHVHASQSLCAVKKFVMTLRARGSFDGWLSTA